MQIFYNIIFGVAMTGGLVTFSAPGIIDYRYPLVHFRNFQTITIHILLIFVPFYLVKIGELQIRLRNIWMVYAGFVGVGAISMTASQVSGQNRGWALYVAEMEYYVGVYIPFPWHYLALFLAMLTIPTVVYSLFEIWTYRKKKKQLLDIGGNKYSIAYVTTLFVGITVATFMLLLIPLTFSQTPVKNLLGLLCLIPILVLIATIATAYCFKCRSVEEG